MEHHSRVSTRTSNMSAKAILVFCAQALLVKSALSQCIGAGLAYDGLAGWGGRGFAYDGLAAPLAYDGLAGWGGRGLAYDGLAAPLAYDGFGYAGRGFGPALDYTPTSGGALPVSSGSAIAPIGISIVSENAYDGILEVAGELPFVGTVALEGVLPTAGIGAVNHACGNGINAMVSEDTVFAPEYYGAAIAPAAGLGYRGGWAGRGIGCGL